MHPFTFLAIVFSCFFFETGTHLSLTDIFISVVLVSRVYHVLRLALEFCTEIHGPQCWTENKKRKRIKEANGFHVINRCCFVCNVRSSDEYVWMLSVLPLVTRTRGTQKFPELLKIYLKWSYKFEILVNFKPPFPPYRRNWMQRSQRRSHCWKHCLKSSTTVLSGAASWTSVTSAKCLPCG